MAPAATARRHRAVRFGRPPSLTPHQRREAMERLAQGAAQAELARSYGVSQSKANPPDPFWRGRIPATGVTRVTTPITMGILAVTRAAETCDRCDNPSHACRGGGLSVGRPATVSRARQKC